MVKVGKFAPMERWKSHERDRAGTSNQVPARVRKAPVRVKLERINCDVAKCFRLMATSKSGSIGLRLRSALHQWIS